MSIDSAQQVKMWIFANACKHGLESILKILAHDQTLAEHLSFQTLLGDEPDLTVDSQFLFMLLLKKLVEMLKVARPCLRPEKKWNDELLSLSIELLNHSYTQQQFISFSRFTHLLTRLKILEIFVMFFKKEGSAAITHKVKTSFPLCTPQFLNRVQQEFDVKDERSLDNLKGTHSDCRKFFFKLAAIKDPSKNVYFKNEFKSDFKKRMKEAIVCLKQTISILKRKIPPSMIEKIIQGEYENHPAYADDPTIQLIPEYVKSADDLGQFMSLLQALDSNPELKLTDGLGSMSTMSDVESESQLSSSNEGEDDDIEVIEEYLNGCSQFKTEDPDVPEMYDASGVCPALDTTVVLSAGTDVVVDSEEGSHSGSDASTLAMSPRSKLPKIHKFLRSDVEIPYMAPCIVKLLSPRKCHNDPTLPVIFS